MSRVIVDLAAKRQGGGGSGPLLHPAGVTLPFDGPADAALIIPEIRSEIRSGAYCAAVIQRLPETLRPGDRVLVIGAGLGVVSTLIGKTEGIERVIAIEANTTLVPYLSRVNDANGVTNVEPVNAVLAQGKKGRVPFFVRRDLRASSLVPHDRSWQQVMMVPFMDIDLILTEEEISLIVCDIPVASARLLAEAELAKVERILLGSGAEDEDCWAADGLGTLLEQLGYAADRSGSAVLFRRTAAAAGRRRRAPAAPVEAPPPAAPEPAAVEAAEPRSATIHPIPLRSAGPDHAGPGRETDPEPDRDELAPDDDIDADGADDDLMEIDLPDGPPGRRQESAHAERDGAEDDGGSRPPAPAGDDDTQRRKPAVEPGELVLEAALSRGPKQPAGSPARAEDGLPAPGFTEPELWSPARPVLPPKPDAPEAGVGPGTEAETGPTPEAGSAPAPQPPGPGIQSGPEDSDEAVAQGDAARASDAGSTAPGSPPAPGTVAAPAADPRRRRRRRRHRAAPEAMPQRPAPGRLRGLAILSLLLALPLMLIGEIASNRAAERAAAIDAVAAEWGGAQTLTGPFLVIPVATGAGPADPLVLLPDSLEVTAELAAGVRRLGRFEVPVYRGRHDLRVAFDPAMAESLLSEGETADWSGATLALGITEPRALRGTLILEGGRAAVPFEAGTLATAAMPGIHAPTGDPRGYEGGWQLTIELDGSQRFELTPAARVTEARLRSNWASPGFVGAFPPDQRAAGSEGFAADWSVPQLAHGLPQAFRGTSPLAGLTSASFGAAFVAPGDFYENAGRALRYGLVLIVLTFGAIFLMERWAPRPPHVAQYALVGVAQCCFFVLLLSFAEQTGLGAAYALASLATIGLLTAYGWFGIALGRRSLWLGAALAVLHALMYLVLADAELTLLAGAMLAFLVTAVAMWGTRGGDWAALLRSLRPRPLEG